MHHTLNEEANKTDKLEFENKKLTEHFNTTQKEKEVIIIIDSCIINQVNFNILLEINY